MVFDECRYEYQTIVTNIDYMIFAEIFNDYNQRWDKMLLAYGDLIVVYV